ncbi:MAG: DUF3068 domain-containing protein [Chloroflexi bacterium]|nr:DUF3068 domain-containing protein [Chloroflexota bacterium]
MNKQASIAIFTVGVVGLVLLIFGIVWGTVIFDRFEKVPSDLDRVVELEGSYTVVDTSFTDSLTGNATLGGLLASGALASLSSDPAVAAQLANPQLAGLVSNPAIVGLISNPAALQLLASPEVGALLSNAAVLGALSDPAVLGALADPTKLPALAAASPELAQILSDPAILGVLTDPTFAGLLASGTITALTSSPEVLAMISDPAIVGALTNPAVGALLADPSALALVLDPRTQMILANPAILPTVDIPVNLHRTRVAVDSNSDSVTLREQITTTIAGTGTELPGFPTTDVKLVVDRKSKEYLPGTEGGRHGHWGLPFHVQKDEAYPSWISAAKQAFDAVFDSEDNTNGLDTYRYVVRTVDAPMGVNDPATGLPLVFATETIVWVEPATGAGVDATVKDNISALAPDGQKYLRFSNDLKYSDTTVEALVQDAKSNKSKLDNYGTMLPWATGIAGLVLLIISVLGGAWLMSAGRKSD